MGGRGWGLPDTSGTKPTPNLFGAGKSWVASLEHFFVSVFALYLRGHVVQAARFIQEKILRMSKSEMPFMMDFGPAAGIMTSS